MGNRKRDQFEKEHGFRPPFVMILSPTWQCNLKCSGCYTLGYQRHPGLSYDLVKRILKECTDMGLHFVTVLGGEPFMYPYLFQMIEEHSHIFFQVYTNGTLMTKEKAEKIRDLGNAMVVVSCEGYEEETDRWRGPGVYTDVFSVSTRKRPGGHQSHGHPGTAEPSSKTGHKIQEDQADVHPRFLERRSSCARMHCRRKEIFSH